jgi:predicted transposase YbfD/YdcC
MSFERSLFEVIGKSQRWHPTKNNYETETRFFILTKKYTAEEALRIIRGHWQIENNLHHVLDVNLKEDARLRSMKNGKMNLGTIGRIALNALTKLKEEKISMYRTQRRISMSSKRLREAIDIILKALISDTDNGQLTCS